MNEHDDVEILRKTESLSWAVGDNEKRIRL